MDGVGTVKLTAANNYTGDTTVLDGILQVTNNTGSATGTGTLTVNQGATLTGTGNAGNATINIAGNVDPGTVGGVGTINVGGGGIVTLANTASLAFDVKTAGTPDKSPHTNTGNHDKLIVNGALTFTAGSVVNIGGTATGFDSSRSYSWTLATATGGINGTPTVGTLSGDFAGLSASQFAFDTATSGGVTSLYVSYAPIPEPATVLGISAAGLGAAGWLRRRRAAAARVGG